MKTTWDKIKQLSSKQYHEILENCKENLYDRQWCFMNKINYINPNFKKALQKTYQEFIQTLPENPSLQNAS